MRENHLLPQIDPIAATGAPGTRHPFSNAIDREDGRFVERRAKIGARGMGEMVFAEKNSIFWNPKLRRDRRAHPELVDHPRDHRLAEDLVRLRVRLQDGHQDTVEFSERLFEKGNIVDISTVQASRSETKLYGGLGEAVIVFDAREAFLFCSRDQ